MFNNKPIAFRERPLENLNSPERLDELITVTSPRLWMGLAGLLLLSALVIGWAVFARIPVMVQGEGILLSRSGLLRLTSPEPGRVRALNVRPGDTVAPGQPVATIEHDPSEPGTGSIAYSLIRSPKAGRVIEIIAGNGASVAAGAPIVTLAPEGEELRATLFVPYSAGKLIRPGMKVRLTLASLRAGESGYLLGTVENVAEFPASPDAMLNLLQNPRLVDRFSPPGGAPLMVSARLAADPESPGGYRWSFRGPAPEIHPGMLCEAGFVLRQLRPIELLFRFAGATQGP